MFANMVKTTVLLTDLGQFAEINKVYAGFFAKPYPARACYEVKALPKGAKVEIEAVIRSVERHRGHLNGGWLRFNTLVFKRGWRPFCLQ